MASAQFSGALRLTDLNDFLGPSQDCIKPVEIDRSSKPGGVIKIEADGTYSEVKEGVSNPLQKVSVTLADCLACSGCVTSAEAILLEQQSHKELQRALTESKEGGGREVVVTLSPQSVAALAVRYGLSAEDTALKLVGFLKQRGAARVHDSSEARELSLLEMGDEFIRRYTDHQAGESTAALPLITGICPGWVCYSEKTHGDLVVPHLATTCSPQQITGSLIKRQASSCDTKVWHCAIMPCHDKKLEASRADFTFDDQKDVDCVITTGEVELLLEEEGVSLNDVTPAQLDSLLGDSRRLWSHPGGASGGYVEHVFRHAASRLFGTEVTQLNYKTMRNSDHRELTLEVEGEVKLRFATIYGFRNIQNLVQKLKRRRCQYHFVEVMACPSGCLNGGGQPTVGGGPAEQKEHLSRLAVAYGSIPVTPALQTSVVGKLREELAEGDTSRLLHTQYHALPKVQQTALNIKW